MNVLSWLEDVPELGDNEQSLLSALLSKDATDREFFKQWIEAVDFDQLDYSSFRLIPAVFKKFGGYQLCEPYRGRMKGIYRYFFFRNNLLAAEAHKAIVALTDAGIETLLFKGLAVALRYHDDFALRPMADVDVLIRRQDVQQAETILQGLGWHYRYHSSKKVRDIHSHDYIHANNLGFDLHWYALYESVTAGIDENLWSRAEEATWQGAPVRFMSPEDLVLVAMVNGRREPDAMRYEWMFDVVNIVRKTPDFNWGLVWEEAGRRQLRHLVFDALLMITRAVPDVFSLDALNVFLEKDRALSRKLLIRLISENRTASLDQMQRPNIELILNYGADSRSWWQSRFPHTSYERLARDTSTPKYIRYQLDSTGQIVSLYLHWHHLPLIEGLFKVTNIASLERLRKGFPKSGEGSLEMPPGLLALPETNVQPHYRARIDVVAGSQEITVPAEGVGEVFLQVTNESKCCWVVSENSWALYGVSYHLLSAAGDLIQWDQPRSYFIRPLKNHLGFVASGQKLACKMKVHAPAEPGRYLLQLDVLQETVLWFSAMQRSRFPVVWLNVIE